MDAQRLVVVSNRLPVVVEDRADGGLDVSPGGGGLVTALAPVLRDRGGLWMGWLGRHVQGDLSEFLRDGEVESGYALQTVDLSEDEVRMYYQGFSNEVVWPLFHDFVSRCNFDPAYWPVYQRVNQRFASRIAEHTSPGDYVWVQDYHLMLVADSLRRIGVERDMGFFLHIPFPSPDIFMKLPQRREILAGLLEFDLVGFQTARDRRNFIRCVQTLHPRLQVKGRGQVCEVHGGDRVVRVGAFPISIDFREFDGLSRTDEAARQAWMVHANLPERQIILGVDRLDYSKGIPNRIQAVARAVERYPELAKTFTYVQVVVPSRVDVPEYQALRAEIERLVGEVNGRLTRDGWQPVQYMFRSLSRVELVGYYRTSEVCLVTPFRDGMNLVAKEFCASSVDETGVLVLSEFAGAAYQLHRHALLVNPWDLDAVVDALHRALHMSQDERRGRMRKLRASIRRQDIFRWVNGFLRAAIARDLSAFPQGEDVAPMAGA